MWKGFFDLIRQVFTLTDAVQKTQSDVTQIKQDLRELTLTVVRQGFEIQMMREREAHEREKQELRREIGGYQKFCGSSIDCCGKRPSKRIAS